MREQEAIAAAMMLSEQMRREDRGTTYFYVKRIGLSVSALSLAGMIMLLAYTQLTRGEFNPTPGMVILTSPPTPCLSLGLPTPSPSIIGWRCFH